MQLAAGASTEGGPPPRHQWVAASTAGGRRKPAPSVAGLLPVGCHPGGRGAAVPEAARCRQPAGQTPGGLSAWLGPEGARAKLTFNLKLPVKHVTVAGPSATVPGGLNTPS
jgi:hypothetical protein